MSNGFTAGVLTLFVPILLCAASCARIEGDETSAGTRIRYQSPSAVFDAYREARAKRDWRKCFSCLTPETQNEAVFEVFFSCTESNSKESRAVVEKYVDNAAASAEFEKKYKEKHGIDITETSKGHETDPTYTPPAPDRDLLRDAVAAHVKDKAGFYDAAANLFAKTPASPLGDLKQMVVHDDTATGRVATPGFHYETPPGESPRKVEDKIYKPFEFRRVTGGWLLDSL